MNLWRLSNTLDAEFCVEALETLPEMEYYTGGHKITTKTFNDQLTRKGWFGDDKIIKINDHYMEAVRYAIFSPGQEYLQQYLKHETYNWLLKLISSMDNSI